MPADLAVIGLGPYGLPLAQAAVAANIPTIGFTTGPEAGSLSPAELRRMHAAGFRPGTDAAQLGRVRTAVICAPTPRGADGGLDLGQVEAAARTLGEQLRPHTTVILESPVLPGTTEEFLRPLLEKGSGLRAGRDFHLAYSPSRVDPGNRDHTPANTPKVIGGLTPACTESAAAFYGRLTDKVVRARGLREAETVQLLETNFRHVNIALVNEMAVLCHELGVDLWDVIRCAETKPFGFQTFRPGPGVGGHGVPQDLTGHATRTLRMVELAQQVNHRMPRYVVQRAATLLNEHGKSARGARVLLLGVTYKPDLADLQGTPAQEIAIRLMELGASISFHDPLVASWNVLDRPVPRADALYETAADADLTILLQQHRTYDLQGLSVKAQLLLDTRGATPTGAAHRL
ncbi:UDP-N-acetyl-D-glucosamine dehydrogenase [Streptomyces fodineus]|uniref:UDP-N-acetyl-D-glucosamine dehydrogenase n=1 Tax=Streptomyces fodineus TaxID=1904616 RepID=A0A1D7YA97_9ACTN|nr:nucleotide sugar dehydrogenase [Streptomyces fodineus]AOR32558.1 UDP-N-acetyl-D-glucosamine dehydrogenase [Streptomyces fodineus]